MVVELFASQSSNSVLNSVVAAEFICFVPFELLDSIFATGFVPGVLMLFLSIMGLVLWFVLDFLWVSLLWFAAGCGTPSVWWFVGVNWLLLLKVCFTCSDFALCWGPWAPLAASFQSWGWLCPASMLDTDAVIVCTCCSSWSLLFGLSNDSVLGRRCGLWVVCVVVLVFSALALARYGDVFSGCLEFVVWFLVLANLLLQLLGLDLLRDGLSVLFTWSLSAAIWRFSPSPGVGFGWLYSLLWYGFKPEQLVGYWSLIWWVGLWSTYNSVLGWGCWLGAEHLPLFWFTLFGAAD